MKSMYFILVPLLGLLAVVGYSATGESDIQINPQIRYQTMRGWEATDRLWEIDKALNAYNPGWEQYGDEIFDRLVNEMGINRIRVGLPSGWENPVDYWDRFVRGDIDYKTLHRHLYEKINDNADPASVNPQGFQFTGLDYRIEKFVLPIKERVEANGEKLFINFCYMDFNWSAERGSLEHALHPDEFAEFVLVYFTHLRDKYGLVPDAFEVILEPDNTTYWRGGQIARGLQAAATALREHGFEPDIIVPSTAHLENARDYFDAIVQVDGTLQHIDTLSYHRYGYTDKAPAKVRATLLEGIRERAAQMGVNTAMLEHVKGDVDELIEDLTIANAGAWQQYGIATNHSDNGAYYYLLDGDAHSIRPARRSYELASIFRHVRMNAVRIQAVSDNPFTDALAFVNQDGRHVAIARPRNPFGSTVRISGLPAGRYALEFTPSGKPSRRLDEISVADGGVLVGHAPGAGVLVAYRQ